MFDRTAARYDLMNDLLSGGLDRRWRAGVTAEIDPGPGMRILDLGAGPGSSTVPLADAGASVVPADLSLGMLRHGKRRRPDLDFVAADATALPFVDESFDVVTISFALRNVVDHLAGLAEMLRVTKRGGRLVVCEFSTATNPVVRTVYQRAVLRTLPVVAKAASSNPDSYHYLAESIRDWPDQPTLAATIRSAGWGHVGWRNLSGGIVALHSAVRVDPTTGDVDSSG